MICVYSLDFFFKHSFVPVNLTVLRKNNIILYYITHTCCDSLVRGEKS